MLASGREDIVRVMVNKSGETAHSTKEIGLKTRLMDTGDLSTLTETCMKESGKTISNMEKVLKHGLMELSMKEVTLKEKNMEKVVYFPKIKNSNLKDIG